MPHFNTVVEILACQDPQKITLAGARVTNTNLIGRFRLPDSLLRPHDHSDRLDHCGVE